MPGELGRHRSRQDHADADAIETNLLHERLAERHESRFRGAICSAAGESVAAGEARDVDDPPATRSAQRRNRRARAVERPGQVDVDGAMPVGVEHRRDVAEDADARVVDEHVESAEARDRVGDQAIDGGAIADVHGVAGNAGRVTTFGRERIDGTRHTNRIRTGQHDVAAVGQNRAGNRAADSATASSDDRSLSTVHDVKARIAPMSDVSILGAGPIGAAIAHRLAQRAQVSAIRLIDRAAPVAAGKALDIQQSGPVEHFDTIVTAGSDPLEAAGAGVIVVADAAIADADDHVESSLALVAQLLRAGTTAPFVFAGPYDAELMERCVRDLNLARDRAVGTASSAIVGTVRAMAAVEMNVSAVEVAVIGRAPSFVVAWSTACADGLLVTDRVPAHTLLAMSRSLPRFWPPGPYAIASATAPIVEALILGSRRLHPATVVLGKEHTAPGVAAMLPLELAERRVRSSPTPSLSPVERNAFVNSLG